MPRSAKLRIRWVKSAIGYSQRQKATIRALGLRRLGDEVEKEDHPTVRGMISRVSHLVKVEEESAKEENAKEESAKEDEDEVARSAPGEGLA